VISLCFAAMVVVNMKCRSYAVAALNLAWMILLSVEASAQALAPSSPAGRTAASRSPTAGAADAPDPATAPPASAGTVPAAAPSSPSPVAAPAGYMLVPVSSVAQAPREDGHSEAREREEAIISGYQEGDPVPAGYRVVREPRRGLVIAGSIVGGIAYGFSVVGAVGDDFKNKSAPLLLPVVGPWIMLAIGGASDKSCDYSSTTYTYDSNCGDRAGLRTALALDGMMQVAGATMLAFGIGYPKTRLIPSSTGLSIAPVWLARNAYGVGATGRF
jgi:hypothetical protein